LADPNRLTQLVGGPVNRHVRVELRYRSGMQLGEHTPPFELANGVFGLDQRFGRRQVAARQPVSKVRRHRLDPLVGRDLVGAVDLAVDVF
jgi:hypothetical protein